MKFISFNAENLFLHLDFYQGENLSTLNEEEWKKLHYRNMPLKPIVKVRQLSAHMLRLAPHILFICEVGGRQSLENFSTLFLENRYDPYIIEGNSNRGIDMGFLLRKDLPVHVELKSHKDDRLPLMPELKFSRDVLELRVFRGHDLKNPWFIFLGVHLKSQLDPSGVDPQGRKRRKAEVDALVGIYYGLEKEFAGRVPVIVGGDFNGKANRPYPDPEFSPIYNSTKLEDALELVRCPKEKRITHHYFHPNGFVEHLQFDYLFLPPRLHSLIVADETCVSPFTDTLFPRNREEQATSPSDHYPVLVTIKSNF